MVVGGSLVRRMNEEERIVHRPSMVSVHRERSGVPEKGEPRVIPIIDPRLSSTATDL